MLFLVIPPSAGLLCTPLRATWGMPRARAHMAAAEEPLELLPDAPAEHLRTVDGFLANAEELRGTFDENFEDPRQAHPQRFVWDYWHVPDQYTLHRTQVQCACTARRNSTPGQSTRD